MNFDRVLLVFAVLVWKIILASETGADDFYRIVEEELNIVGDSANSLQKVDDITLFSFELENTWSNGISTKLQHSFSLYDVLLDGHRTEGKLLLLCINYMTVFEDCVNELFPSVESRIQAITHDNQEVRQRLQNFKLNITATRDLYNFIHNFGVEQTHSISTNYASTSECFLSWETFDRNLIMVVVHHKGANDEVLRNMSRLAVIEPAEIESSVLFEYLAYRTYLSWKVAPGAYNSYDYVGLTTYTTFSHAPLCGDDIQRLYEIGIAKGYDVMPLVFLPHRKLMVEGVAAHTRNFKIAWDLLLQSMGYELATIRKFDMIRPFYRNSMLIKPAWLKIVCSKMFSAFHHAMFNETVFEALSRPANYANIGGAAEVARKIFGSDEYQLFPFVFERLVSFFLHAEGASIYFDPDIKPWTQF